MLPANKQDTTLPVPSLQMIGESCLLMQWGNVIDREVNSRVHTVSKFIFDQNIRGIIDVIPAYSSITVLFDLFSFISHNNKTPFNYFTDFVGETDISAAQSTSNAGNIMQIPVCYDSNLGNDLESLSLRFSIKAEEIIQRHTSSSYYVYMLGFLPGFSYMGEVDDRISFARKEKPVAVKAGAVAIAGKQTGIYPVNSPGGWNIVGYTPLKIFDASQSKPCLIEPGSTVVFNPIDIETYYTIKNNSSL